MDPKGFVIIAAGLFSIFGALSDWDGFMNHPKARFFNRIWGRQGTRLFYGALGTTMVVLGFAVTSGAVQ